MPPRRPPSPPRRRRRTARAVKSAAARAVEQVLSSQEAFDLLMRRLEAAGWHIERAMDRPVAPSAGGALTPPARAR